VKRFSTLRSRSASAWDARGIQRRYSAFGGLKTLTGETFNSLPAKRNSAAQNQDKSNEDTTKK
jgi:hypothetical protein